MADLPSDVGNEGSFLTDKHLNKDTLEHLFQKGSFDEKCIRHASYELRLGSTVKVNIRNTPEDEGQRLENYQQVKWDKEKDGEDDVYYIDIKPKQRALIYTKEVFNFPDNALGLVICRGLLFSLGMTPENTYVDPGFNGNLYITITNTNENIIRLEKGMNIARLLIFKLNETVEKKYVNGDHLGIDQQLAEIPVREFWSKNDLGKINDEEILKSIVNDGCSISDLLEQMISRQKRYSTRTRHWLIFLVATFVVVLVWPVIWPLLEKITLPSWFGENVFRAIIAPLFGAAAIPVVSLVKRGFSSIRLRKNR